jgi:hypothetical protein
MIDPSKIKNKSAEDIGFTNKKMTMMLARVKRA